MKDINQKLFAIDHVLKKATGLIYFSVILAILSVLGVVGYSFYVYNQTSNNIYIMDDEGDINPATKTNKFGQLEAEADNHIKMFYNTFFSYDPVNVEINVQQGIELGGKSVKDVWKVYKNNNWYNQIKQNNMIVKSTVDSTFFDFKSNPYRCRVYGKQTITSFDYVEQRNLHLECTLIPVSRVKGKNPHGLLIDNLNIFDNETIPQE